MCVSLLCTPLGNMVTPRKRLSFVTLQSYEKKTERQKLFWLLFVK